MENSAYEKNGTGTGRGGAIYINSGSGHLVQNCVIVSNDAYNAGGGIYVSVSGVFPIINCTIADNHGTDADHGVYVSAGTVHFTNSIVWNNGDDIAEGSGTITLDYCCIEDGTNGYAASGCITNDPLFADGVGDFHLKSESGRWDPTEDGGSGGWQIDSESSPCIDTADPATPWTGLEPAPNGNDVNMGAYGNTAQASKTVQNGTLFLIR